MFIRYYLIIYVEVFKVTLINCLRIFMFAGGPNKFEIVFVSYIIL